MIHCRLRLQVKCLHLFWYHVYMKRSCGLWFPLLYIYIYEKDKQQRCKCSSLRDFIFLSYRGIGFLLHYQNMKDLLIRMLDIHPPSYFTSTSHYKRVVCCDSMITFVASLRNMNPGQETGRVSTSGTHRSSPSKCVKHICLSCARI